MKNIANSTKDYLLGFAEGFGEYSIKFPYFTYSFLKEKNPDKNKISKPIELGSEHGTSLGILSTAIQIFVCLNLLYNHNPTYVEAIAGTNLLSILYENYKYLWKD